MFLLLWEVDMTKYKNILYWTKIKCSRASQLGSIKQKTTHRFVTRFVRVKEQFFALQIYLLLYIIFTFLLYSYILVTRVVKVIKIKSCK